MGEIPPPATTTQPVFLQSNPNDPGCLIRILWYILVGWWLSGIMITIGWALVVTVIFLPVGLWFLHRVPWAQTLRPRTREFHTVYRDGATFVSETTIPQHPWYVRLVYIVFIGWWWGAIWLSIAWLMGLLLITLPISILMIDRSPAMVSLQRN